MNFFVERIQTKIGNNSGTEIDPKITPLFPGIEVKIKDINDTDFMLSHIRLECTTIKKDSYIMHKLEGKYNVSYVILYGSYWPLDASVRVIQPTSYTHRQTHTHTNTHTKTQKIHTNTRLREIMKWFRLKLIRTSAPVEEQYQLQISRTTFFTVILLNRWLPSPWLPLLLWDFVRSRRTVRNRPSKFSQLFWNIRVH